MRSKTNTAGPKSTVLPYLPNSCQNCWNKLTTSAEDDLAPRSHGIYVSLPVYLIEPDGHILDVCYRAQCPDCGDVRPGGVYKLDGTHADFKPAYWPEIRKYGLDPKAFVQILCSQPETRYFEVVKLPKYESKRHQADFYEPKRKRDELYS